MSAAPAGQPLVEQQTVRRPGDIGEGADQRNALIGVDEALHRIPARRLDVGRRGDEAGIFGDALGNFEALFRLRRPRKCRLTMLAECEGIADRLHLRRPALDQRCRERPPFELHPQAPLCCIELQVRRIRRVELERRLDSVEQLMREHLLPGQPVIGNELPDQHRPAHPLPFDGAVGRGDLLGQPAFEHGALAVEQMPGVLLVGDHPAAVGIDEEHRAVERLAPGASRLFFRHRMGLVEPGLRMGGIERGCRGCRLRLHANGRHGKHPGQRDLRYPLQTRRNEHRHHASPLVNDDEPLPVVC